MTHHRILMLVLIAATVCMVGVGMGAAEDVSATISTSEFSGTYNVGLVDPYGDYDDDTILNKYDPLPAIAEDTSISWDIGNKWYYDYHDNSDNTYHRGVAVSDVTVIDNQTVYLLNDIGENGQLSSFYKIYTPGLNLIGFEDGVDNYLDVIIDDYNFPLYAGKEWAYTDYYGGYYDLTVVGEELVTLANGQSFNAYRIEKWVHQGSFLHHETIWFSTDVKNYVKKVWYDALGNPYGFEELSTWLVDPYGDYDSDTILNKYDPLPAIAEDTSISWTIGNKWYYDYHDNSGNTYHRGVAVSDVTVIDNQTVYLLNDIGENGQLSSFYEIYTPGLNIIGFGDGVDIHLGMIFDEYNFPLYAGKEWAYSDYYGIYTYTLTVAGEELVTLANGQSFNAYRIEKWRKWDDSYNSHSDHVETIWFSTDVKNYVKKVQYNAIGNPYSFEELSTWLVDPYGDYDGDTILNKYDPLPAIAEDTSISWTIGNKWYYDYHDNSGSIFHRGVAVSDVTVIDNQTVYLLNDIDENGQLSSFYEIYTPGLNLIGFGDGVDNYLDMIFDDYNFPLYAGKEWAYSDYYGIYTYTYTHTVAGEELVTLANGQSFNAYRIEKWRKWDNSYNSHSDHVETIWFSTDVKNYVKRVFYDALGNPSGFEELDSINYNAEKKLLQIEGQPEVYWLQNNKLYWVTDWDVINQMSGIPGWDSVNALPASEFDPAAYAQGPRFIDTGAISDGLLIRERGHPEIYLISGGEKHHIISEEVFLSMGYSFDDVIDVSPQIIEIFPTGSDIGAGFTVGQGASTPEITEAFNVAYEKNGGVTVLGDPTSAVYNKWGYEVQEFPGTDTYPGGITIYNPDKSAAFYIHGDIWNRYNALGGPVATTDKEFQLGIPTSDVLPYAHLDKPKISKYDTPYRHQNFESDNEKAALVHNLNSEKVVEIHGAIYEKWNDVDVGLADGVLGLVTEDEMEAGQSPDGTTGRYSKFEKGTIHWNEQSGNSNITYGDLDAKYTELDGTNGLLGFPIMDQEVKDGHGYCEFEGGYIEWDSVSEEYIVKEFSPLSVRITAPNYDSQLIEDEIATFSSQVSGGIPPYKFEWQDDAGDIFSNLQTFNFNFYDFYGDNIKKFQPIGINKIWLIVTDATGVKNSDYVRVYVVPPADKVKVDSAVYQDGKQVNNPIMNKPYELRIMIENMDDNPHYYSLKLKTTPEDNAHTNYIWDINPITTEIKNDLQTQLIQPGGTNTFTYEFKSNWVWIVPEDGIPRELMNDIAELLIPTLGTIWNIEDTFEIITGKMIAQPAINFRFKPDKLWSTPTITCDVCYANVNAYVGNDKMFAYHGYLLDRSIMVIGPIAAVKYPNIAVILASPAALLQSKYYYKKAIDPDPDYKVVINPEPYNVPEINSLPDGLYKELAQISFEMLSYNRAEVDSYVRYVAADEDNAYEYQLLQLEAIKKYNDMQLEKISEINDIYRLIIQDQNSLTDEEITDIKNDVRINGLPTEWVSILTREGLENEIPQVIQRILDADGALYKNQSLVIDGNIGNAGTRATLSDKYVEDIIEIKVNKLGQTPNEATHTEIEELEILENDIQLGLDRGYATQKLKDDIKSMFYLANALIIQTNNNEYLHYYSFATDAYVKYLTLQMPIDIYFWPPITNMDQFSLTDGSTLPIKFSARDNDTNEFIYDDTVNVTITNSTGHLLTYFTNGTGTDNVRINTGEEQYIVNFHSKNYGLNVGENYAVTVTFGESDSLSGYEITHFTLLEGGKAKGKNK